MGDLADIRQQKINFGNDLGAESDALWSFSLAFYGRPDVADALVALQDKAGLNVNLALFAIWVGLSGRGRLDAQRIGMAERAVHPIEIELIRPLRALRRQLKPVPDPDVQALRDRIKGIEIDAEKFAQTKLAAIAGPISKRDPSARLADAEANLLGYLGAEHQSGSPATVIHRELRLWAANR